MKRLFKMMLTSVVCASVLCACTQAAPAETASEAQPEASQAAASEEAKPESESAEPEAVTKGDAEKKAILVVSFGTSYNDSRDATIGAIESDIANANPDYEVRRAFTSQIIIDKLKKRDNLEIDNVTQAMERLVADEIGTVIVQPTHVMHGFEYDDMKREVEAFADHFETLKFGDPLLTTTQDYTDSVAAIKDQFQVADDTALVLMGHGTEHFANNTYAALAYHFNLDGDKNIFVGTVEGFPDLDTTIEQVKALGVQKVQLAPFMVVSGDHATKDMAGDEEGSWKTAFKAQGFEVDCVLNGMGEYQSIRDIYVAHVARAIEGETEE